MENYVLKSLYLLVAIVIAQSRKYDIEFEAFKLYGQNVSGVLNRFRKSSDYVKILKDKTEDLKKEFLDNYFQTTKFCKTKLDKPIFNMLGIDLLDLTNTTTNGSTSTSPDSVRHGAKQKNIDRRGPARIPVSYFTFKERIKFKDLGSKFAGASGRQGAKQRNIDRRGPAGIPVSFFPFKERIKDLGSKFAGASGRHGAKRQGNETSTMQENIEYIDAVVPESYFSFKERIKLKDLGFKIAGDCIRILIQSMNVIGEDLVKQPNSVPSHYKYNTEGDQETAIPDTSAPTTTFKIYSVTGPESAPTDDDEERNNIWHGGGDDGSNGTTLKIYASTAAGARHRG